MTDDTQPQPAADSPSPRRPDRRRSVPLRTKLAFSSGAFQEGMVVAGRITTLIFYNQVLGVSAALCGVAYVVASIVDAVSDPMVGAISDRFRSRWGRRHPLMLMSALPIAISFYFLYRPISGLSEGALFAWQVCFLVLLRISTSFHNIPRDALGAELTDDHEYRTGNRAEGVIFSVREFAMKATEGFGGLIGGIGLELIRFPQNAEVEGVSAGTVTGLLVMSGPLCLVIYGVGILFMMLYRLNAGRHEEILTVLEARRAARATGVSSELPLAGARTGSQVARIRATWDGGG